MTTKVADKPVILVVMTLHPQTVSDLISLSLESTEQRGSAVLTSSRHGYLAVGPFPFPGGTPLRRYYQLPYLRFGAIAGDVFTFSDGQVRVTCTGDRLEWLYAWLNAGLLTEIAILRDADQIAAAEDAGHPVVRDIRVEEIEPKQSA